MWAPRLYAKVPNLAATAGCVVVSTSCLQSDIHANSGSCVLLRLQWPRLIGAASLGPRFFELRSRSGASSRQSHVFHIETRAVRWDSDRPLHLPGTCRRLGTLTVSCRRPQNLTLFCSSALLPLLLPLLLLLLLPLPAANLLPAASAVAPVMDVHADLPTPEAELYRTRRHPSRTR